MRLLDISKIYHNKTGDYLALDHINLSIASKGVTCIVGPSGCGKTTLLHIIANIDKDYTGIIENSGIVECIPQELLLMENLSIMDNLRLVSEDSLLIKQLLDHFSLYQPNKKVKKLSVGEKKRVQVIRSLLLPWDYLICDEPTASIDYESSKVILDILKEQSREKAIIIVTHELAIVDMYADDVIQMGNGCILKHTVCNTYEVTFSNTCCTRTVKKHLWLIFALIKTRMSEMGVRFLIYSSITLLIYSMIFLFPTLSDTLQAQTNWKYAKNIITPIPLNPSKSKDAKAYLQYDLYTKEDLNLIKERNLGVIGYQMGWNFHVYDNHEEGSSFIPYVSLDGLKSILKKYEPDSFGQYQYMKSLLNEDRALFPNYEHFIGYNDANSMGFEPITHYIQLGYEDVMCYQLFDGVILPLIHGRMPNKINDVVINKDLAYNICRTLRIEKIDSLIGKEMSLNYVGHVGEDVEYKNYPVTISGISSMECRVEKQLFFMDGGFEKIFIEEYGCNPEKATFQYMILIMNPKLDSEKITETVNKLLHSKDSRFVVLGTMNMQKESFQDIKILGIFFSFALVVVLVIYAIMHLLLDSRMTKEQRILKQYLYQPVAVSLGLLVWTGLWVSISQFFFLKQITFWLNEFVSSLGFDRLFTYDLGLGFVSVVIAFGILSGMEMIMYGIRTKKY